MNKHTKLFTVLTSLPILIVFISCHELECGEGTVEKNGVCVNIQFPDNDGGAEMCAPGTHWNPNLGKCFVDPDQVCGSGTEIVWSEDGNEFTCESTGQGSLPECPEPGQDGSICINGYIRHFVDPSQKSSFMTNIIEDPAMLTNMEIAVYDPLDYASVGAESVPLGIATIDATNGTFIATDIQIPSQGYVALVTRDLGWTRDATPANWVFTGFAYKATAGVNLIDTDAVAVSATTLEEWRQDIPSEFISDACQYGDIFECGTWIGVYKDENPDNDMFINGVKPYYKTNTQIPPEKIAFLDKNESGEYSVLTPGTDRVYTSETGVVMYFGAELTKYFGLCDYTLDEEESRCLEYGFNFPKTLQGGSSSRALFVQYVKGTATN
ncbi:MAG: hypothetical protein ACQES9_03715 [Myxococcota bacterium]